MANFYSIDRNLQNREATILAVDDNTMDVDLLRYGLAEANIQCRVHQAETGKAARAWLAEHGKPDVLVLDLQLPDESGLSILKMVATNSALSSTPVLVLSGVIRDGDRLQAQSCGAFCATKPFDIDEWVELAGRLETFWLRHHVHAVSAA